MLELLDEELCGTASIAYVECCAAFARRAREGYLEAAGHETAIGELDVRWPTLIVVEADAQIIRGAGRLATLSSLRGADAIHLESARALVDESYATVPFACWDRRLWDAARQAGLRTIPARRP